MSISVSNQPWRKDAAYPGQPEINPVQRLQVSTWQDLRKVVHDCRGGWQPAAKRPCVWKPLGILQTVGGLVVA
jgi:hypothetical protein